MTIIDFIKSDEYKNSNVSSVGLSENTGGNIYLDVLYLKDGSVLAISDETISLYANQDDYSQGIIKDTIFRQLN